MTEALGVREDNMDQLTEIHIQEIVTYAQHIAYKQRGEEHLKSTTELEHHLADEYKELADEIPFSVEWYSEIVDIVYYSVCLYHVTQEMHHITRLVTYIDTWHLSISLIFEIWQAKYHIRLANTKDKKHENEAITAVLCAHER